MPVEAVEQVQLLLLRELLQVLRQAEVLREPVEAGVRVLLQVLQEQQVLPLQAGVQVLLRVLQAEGRMFRMTCHIHRKSQRHLGFLYHN